MARNVLVKVNMNSCSRESVHRIVEGVSSGFSPKCFFFQGFFVSGDAPILVLLMHGDGE